MPKRPVKEAERLMQQAYALFENGFSREEIAKSMNVSIRTVHRWLQIEKEKRVKTDVKGVLAEIVTEAEAQIISSAITPSDVDHPLRDLEDYHASQRDMALQMSELAISLLPLLRSSLKRFDTEGITPRTLPALVKTMIDLVNSSSDAWTRATGLEAVINEFKSSDFE